MSLNIDEPEDRIECRPAGNRARDHPYPERRVEERHHDEKPADRPDRRVLPESGSDRLGLDVDQRPEQGVQAQRHERDVDEEQRVEAGAEDVVGIAVGYVEQGTQPQQQAAHRAATGQPERPQQQRQADDEAEGVLPDKPRERPWVGVVESLPPEQEAGDRRDHQEPGDECRECVGDRRAVG